MAMVGVASGCLYGRLAARVVRPGLRVGGRLVPSHIHHINRVNSCSGLSYDDSTINVVVIIIIFNKICRKKLQRLCCTIIILTYRDNRYAGLHQEEGSTYKV